MPAYNPNGPEATAEFAPNSMRHHTVKVRIKRGMAAGEARRERDDTLPSGKYRRNSPKWRAQQRQQHLLQMRDRAVKAGLVEHGLKPTEVLQRLIDDAFIEYAIEDQEIKDAQAKGQKAATTRLRQLRKDAAYFASLALQYNIADRHARQEEIRTQLLATLLQQVLRDPTINLPEAKIKRIPALLEARAVSLQDSIVSATGNASHQPPHQMT